MPDGRASPQSVPVPRFRGCAALANRTALFAGPDAAWILRGCSRGHITSRRRATRQDASSTSEDGLAVWISDGRVARGRGVSPRGLRGLAGSKDHRSTRNSRFYPWHSVIRGGLLRELNDEGRDGCSNEARGRMPRPYRRSAGSPAWIFRGGSRGHTGQPLSRHPCLSVSIRGCHRLVSAPTAEIARGGALQPDAAEPSGVPAIPLTPP